MFAYVGDTNASMDILGLYTVYRRKRNEKRRENHSPYVGIVLIKGMDERALEMIYSIFLIKRMEKIIQKKLRT